jgi:hypothetical protein
MPAVATISLLISLLISMVALSVSFIALLVKRRQDRRELFLKMHERLIDPDLRGGHLASDLMRERRTPYAGNTRKLSASCLALLHLRPYSAARPIAPR